MLNQAQVLLLQKGFHPSGPNRKQRRLYDKIKKNEKPERVEKKK